MQWVDAQVPEKLLFFFGKGPRYKIARGGRGSAKSRKGSPPMRVSTMLKKEKEGTLGGYKLAHVLEALSKAGERIE